MNFVLEIFCTNLTTVTNAYISGSVAYQVDAMLNYTCRHGYRYSDNSDQKHATCMETGTWGGPAVDSGCQPVSCGEIPYIANSIVVDSPPPFYPEVVTYRCTTGHRLSTGSDVHNITCRSNGTWSALLQCAGLLAFLSFIYF